MFIFSCPEITYREHEILVDEGDEVKLSCKAKGKPTPKLYWSKQEYDGKVNF